ncbi:hypothetical protein C2845_PM04G07140 [Panicum miliaceum]|uniref:Uncharacterized protein n=1 Tax=Panicum miliaceum TaxID=4540 RepID=A0A3L6QM99_PANMI|nr:hypothetical protein C2845_PM04G07140 [Panicum miliaceum]
MSSVGLAVEHELQLPRDPAPRLGSLHARCHRKFLDDLACAARKEALIIAGIQGIEANQANYNQVY